MEYYNNNNTLQERKFCPKVMCPDHYVQDPRTCQCRPVAKTVSPALVEDLTKMGGLIEEMCIAVPQIIKDGICTPYLKRNDY